MSVGHADLIIAALARHNGKAKVSESTYGDVIRDDAGKIEHGGSAYLLKSAVSSRLLIVEDGVARLNPDHHQSCDIVALVAERVPAERLEELGLLSSNQFTQKYAIQDVVRERRVLVNGRQPLYHSEYDTTVALSSMPDDAAVTIVDGPVYSEALIADAAALGKGSPRDAGMEHLLLLLCNLSHTVEAAQEIAVKATAVVNSMIQRATAAHRDLDGDDLKRAMLYLAGYLFGKDEPETNYRRFVAAIKSGELETAREAGDAFAAECLEISRRMQAELAAAEQ